MPSYQFLSDLHKINKKNASPELERLIEFPQGFLNIRQGWKWKYKQRGTLLDKSIVNLIGVQAAEHQSKAKLIEQDNSELRREWRWINSV